MNNKQYQEYLKTELKKGQNIAKDIIQETEKVLEEYDEENIDICENASTINIMYHSRHNSFSASEKSWSLHNLSDTCKDELREELEEYAREKIYLCYNY